MNYTITPICLGYNRHAEKGSFTYRKDSGQIITVAYLVYLILGNNLHILVDSGAPNPEKASSMSYPHLEDAVFLEDALISQGVSCNDIDAIILTHLHWDHCYNLEQFPNAKIFVQAKELRHAVDPSPYDCYAYVATPGEGLPGWMPVFSQLTRLYGEEDLFPGIRVLEAPGHTPGQQVVCVDTEEGPYIVASDMYPLFENYERRIPNGISISFDDWYQSDKKIRKLNAKILPGHDPLALKRTVYGAKIL